MSRITLWGFYQFTDKKLFESIQLPNVYNKERLIDAIMFEDGDLYPYYQQPEFLKLHIENFFARKYDDFARMYNALYSEYNPIENYDRQESWEDSGEESGTNSNNETGNITDSIRGQLTENGSHSNQLTENVNGTATDHTEDESASNSLNKVSAMDSNTLVDDTSGETSGTGSSDATTTNESHRGQAESGTTSKSQTETRTDTRTDTRGSSGTDHRESESIHTGRIHGNIGVTTSQQMIESELKLREFDLYERIVKMFESQIIFQEY